MLIPRRSALFDTSYSALVLRGRSPVEVVAAHDPAEGSAQDPKGLSDNEIGLITPVLRWAT